MASSRDKPGDRSMGDLFQQQRRAHQAALVGDGAATGLMNRPSQSTQHRTTTTAATPSSFLEIQAEQERERRYPTFGGGGFTSRPRGTPPGGGGTPYRSNSGGSGGQRRQAPHRPNRTHLPLEQGTICSLKEAFGFIYCADRVDEIFFHFSELEGGIRGSDLQIDDEVEFHIGNSGNKTGDEEKLAAFHVKKLPPGTIAWESEDYPGKRFRGLVERAIRLDRSGSIVADGSIRVLVDKEDGKAAADGPLVRFGLNDYERDEKQEQLEAELGGRGPRGKTPSRLAKGDFVEFSMVTDRRSKDQLARSIKLLQSERERARQEEEKRMFEEASLEHGVVVALKGEYGFLQSNRRREQVFFHYSSMELDDHDDDDLVLKEGQDVKFLVVTEPREAGQRGRISARQVKIQPRGSVKFHEVVAQGVTGTVAICPQPVDSGHALDKHGKVLLSASIIQTADDGGCVEVKEVYLRTKDSPGGTFPFRGGTSVGLWIEVGDTLLFDVVKDFVDGSYHAAPTLHLIPSKQPYNLEEQKEDMDHNTEQRIRLIELSLTGRSEGIVHTLKDVYGFIHFAERPVDVHFKFFQVIPDELQKDIRRNMGLSDFDDKGRLLKLEEGVEVQFDLSVHGSIHSTAPSRGRGRQAPAHDRENLKAQRVLFLPPRSVVQLQVLGERLQGVVSKEDPKQPYSGFVDLPQPIKLMSQEERHPLVSKMLDKFLEDSRLSSLVFHDIQTSKEDDVVQSLANSKAGERIKISHIPQAGENLYPGRLCIRKVEVGDDAKIVASREVLDDGVDCDIFEEVSEKSGKKKKITKTAKTIHFDKHSLVEELKNDIPLEVGDKVELDLVQSRRTGQIIVENIRLLERAKPKEKVVESTGVGVVTEVATNRDFGVILVQGESAPTRETLLYQISGVLPAHDKNESSPSKRSFSVRKGDEVKFDVFTDKNGKRIATNVMIIRKGSLPVQAEKNTCRGIVLIEPSHSTLKNTPLRHANSNSSQNSDKASRWEQVEDDRKNLPTGEPATELGCILLLEDPSGMFQTRGRSKSPVPPSSDKEPLSTNRVQMHLRYKTGSIASHGTAEDSNTPKRGDLVSFAKAKNGNIVRDIRVVTRRAATMIRGRLEGITLPSGHGGNDASKGLAKFMAMVDGEKSYEIELSEVISCDPAVLKDKEPVEGVLHNGRVYGVCRLADLYLESKLGVHHKERPKLNLTVKKDRGGTIMAQSMMAKGPDGTCGFAKGWTARSSKYTSIAAANAATTKQVGDDPESVPLP